jgi:hypothetical protein
MNKQQFEEIYGEDRKWEWPLIGDKVKFKGADGWFYPHFTDIIQFAKDNLELGKTYIVRNCEVYSSWCAVWLEEIEGDYYFHKPMFEWPIKE